MWIISILMRWGVKSPAILQCSNCIWTVNAPTEQNWKQQDKRLSGKLNCDSQNPTFLLLYWSQMTWCSCSQKPTMSWIHGFHVGHWWWRAGCFIRLTSEDPVCASSPSALLVHTKLYLMFFSRLPNVCLALRLMKGGTLKNERRLVKRRDPGNCAA